MFARVATFEGGQDEVRKLAQEIGSDSEPPEGIPAKELLLLTGLDSGKLTAVVFFETEDDLRRGHATLSEMSPDDASVKRTGVELYEVAARRSM